jgi:hypothetical protein
MTPEFLAHDDNQVNQYGAVNGSGVILSSTDPNYVDPYSSDPPMDKVLKVHSLVYTSTPCASYSNMTYYTELTLNRDRAPTNFIWRNCFAEVHDHGGGPHQQMLATDINPDPATPWHHASLAFGLVALFDDEPANPCDVDTGRRPTAWQAFVYDGANWTRLKYPAFDLPAGDDADFYPWKKGNRFFMFIGTDYFEIRLYNKRAEAIYNNPQGKCGHQSCSTNMCFGGIDHGTGGIGPIGSSGNPECADDADCRPLQGTCVSGFCEGGTNDGGACTQTCPDGICNEDGVCEGGTNDGQPCDCPAAPPPLAQPYFVARVPRVYKGPFNYISLGAGRGVDQMTPKCEEIRNGEGLVCVGGINNGNACASVTDCPPSVGTCVSGFCNGGENHGVACTQTCPDGVCNVEGRCDGGANAGLPCDCPAFEECMQAIASNQLAVDELALWDGEFVPTGGACCVKDGYGKGTCSITTQSNCNSPGSTYLGDGTTCGGLYNENCEFCNTDLVFDTDYDVDVDQEDFSLFQVCFGATSPLELLGCQCFDEHAKVGGGDDNITQEDYIAFEGCASGPNVPADPSCD